MLGTDQLPGAERTRLPYTTRGLMMALAIATEAAIDKPLPEMVISVAKRAINAEFYVGRTGIDNEPGAAWGIAAVRTAQEVSEAYKIPDDSQNIIDGLGLASTVVGLAVELDSVTPPGKTITEVVADFKDVVELKELAEFALAQPDKVSELALLVQAPDDSVLAARTYATAAA